MATSPHRRFLPSRFASRLRWPLGFVVALQLPLAPAPAVARPFDVFCVSNSDGTTTCEGWRGGETLTCVGSPGGVSTCSVPSGRRFTCTASSGGTTSCVDNTATRQDGGDTNCTFTGDGNFVCEPPPRRRAPLLPAPSLPDFEGDFDQPDLPSIPLPSPVITDPSVF